MHAFIKNFVLPALLLMACKDEDAPDEGSTGTTTGGDTEPTGGVEGRSYWRDVAPIY